MKLFQCQACGQVVYFENVRCERCGHRLGYIAEGNMLSALEPSDTGFTARSDGRPYRFCANAEHDSCNWLVPARAPDRFCRACRHNGVIPDLSVPANVAAWRSIELAKHRLFYTLLKLGLPLATRAEDPEHGLLFHFLADQEDRDAPKVLTGHDNGLVTIALIEADDAERERRRKAMGEPYRTLLGHFRHEVGHHFWDLLVRDAGRLEQCRAVFGDDSLDYGEALRRHYDQGAPDDWQETFVSRYATTHPWEDFAESWAHYLHIVDTFEMAGDFGVSVQPQLAGAAALRASVDVDPYDVADFQSVLDQWLPLTAALNGINRCMGLSDLYPFVLTPAVVRKLGYVHALVQNHRHGRGALAGTA